MKGFPKGKSLFQVFVSPRSYAVVTVIAEFLQDISVLRSEETLITSVIEHVPTIVVLGQDYSAKLAVVNALLGQAVLPNQLSESPGGWRVIRLVYGTNKSFSLSVVENFEVVDAVVSRGNAKSVVPIDDLMLKVLRPLLRAISGYFEIYARSTLIWPNGLFLRVDQSTF